MKKLFEELKKELGNVPDMQFMSALKEHKEAIVLQWYDFPELFIEVKLHQFRDIFIVTTCQPRKNVQMSITKSKNEAIMFFGEAFFKIENLKEEMS